MHEMVVDRPAVAGPAIPAALGTVLQASLPVLEHLPIGIYVCDRDGLIVQFNRRAAELWGRAPQLGDSEERFCGSHRLFWPDGRPLPHAETPMAAALRSGIAVRDGEVVIERPDGSRVQALVNIDPLTDEAGTVIGAVNCFQDVSALKQANAEAKQRTEELQDFFENCAVGLHLVGEDGTILRANRAELELLGYRPDEYIGRNIAEFHADPDVIQDILARLTRGEQLDKYPARLKAKDGSIKHVLISSNSSFRDGKFANTRCFTLDVTDWKHAQEALRQYDQRLAITYEHAMVAIAEVDAEGRRLRVNETACALTGYSREELLGTNVFDGDHPDDGGVDASQYRRLVAGEIDRYAVEKRFRRKDGSEVWFAVQCSAVRDDAGRFLHAVRVFQDVTDRRRAIEALAENEQRLAATYEHAAIAITEVDAEGRRLRLNETACSIMGRPREELLGGSIFENVHPDDIDADRAQFRALVEGKIDRYTMLKRYTFDPNDVRAISVTCSAVRDAAGRFRYGVRVFQDITEAKKAADALAESEQRLAASYEHASIGISEADADGVLLRVNEASCALARATRDELLGKPFFARMRPDVAEAERILFREQVEGKRDRYTMEKPIIRRDGTEIIVRVDSSSVRDSSGRFLYAVRILQDVTERTRAEERVRESEARLRQVIEGLPAAVYTTDASGRITYFNQAAVDMWGMKPEIGVTRWCGSLKLFYADGRPMAHEECPMARAVKENRPIRGEEAILERPDGVRVHFAPYPTPLLDAAGNLVGAVNMLVDMTERKNAEERQRLLIDELNHRVKNTLATVQSLANQTARGARSPQAYRERLEGRLIALSKAHDQLSRSNWQHADLAEIAAAGLAPYRLQEGGDNISILGDPIRLPPRTALTFAMIFHELATNAAKYGALSQPTGRLAVEWRVERNGAGPRLFLSWRESGGPRVRPPVRRGFGSMLVERGIGSELGGVARLEFASGGVICEIDIPIESGAVNGG